MKTNLISIMLCSTFTFYIVNGFGQDGNLKLGESALAQYNR